MQLPLEPADRRSFPSSDGDTLDRALKNLQDCDFQGGWEIAKLFPKIGERAIAPLLGLLETDSTPSETRWLILRILGEIPDRESILALGQIVQRSEDEELSAMAAAALASIGRPAIEILAGLLDNQETRLLAVGALSRVRRPEIVAPLLTVVGDQSPEIRAIALEALSSFYDEAIVAVVLAALEDPARAPRRQAVMAAGYLAPRYPEVDFVSHLAPRLGDLDGEIGRATAIALGRIGTEAAIEVLNSALESPCTAPELQLAIVRALGWSEQTKAGSALAKALPSVEGEIRAEIITILGRQPSPLGRARAIEALKGLIDGRSLEEIPTGVKQSLALALGELAELEGRETLLSLATDREASVRLHALWGLKQLDRHHECA
jgi:HEAT repeat protein